MPRKKMTPREYAEVSAGVRLSSHEKLCAERMKVLNESINELKKEVKSLRQDVSKGKGAVSVLVFVGTIIAGIVGYFTWDG
jgi:acid phosphatase family membrane protein YuiD